MKTNKLFKTILILALAMLMALSVAACGEEKSSGSDTKDKASQSDSDDKGSDTAESSQEEENDVAGEKQTWGNITVLVPEDMTLTGGNALDENNPDVLNIAKKDNALNYFLITIVDTEEDASSGLETTRSINEGCKDVSFDAGSQWTGVTYEYSGTPVYQIYGAVGSRFAVVQSYGFDPESDISKAILNSIEVKA